VCPREGRRRKIKLPGFLDNLRPAEAIFDAGAEDIGNQDIDDRCKLFLINRKVGLPGFNDHKGEADKGSPEFTGCEKLCEFGHGNSKVGDS